VLLVLTASDDATANFLCTRLTDEAVRYVRLDTDCFADDGFVGFRDLESYVSIKEQKLSPNNITGVWYRRPRGVSISGPHSPAELTHVSREWGAALDSFLAAIPTERWMNHPAANVAAGHKLRMLTLANELGFHVPDSLVTHSELEARAFWRKHEGQVIVKPLSIGHVSDDASAYTSKLSDDSLLEATLLARCPTLVQQRVDGVDLRVTVVDQSIHALTMMASHREFIDIRRHGLWKLKYNVIDIPPEVRRTILDMMNILGLRFGAFDFICDGGRWVFLECNPNGQWAWTDQLGVSQIATSFVESFRYE
jgi:hypothetical protein